MAINKFQRSRLTFDISAISAKVANIGVPSTYYNIVLSETTRPIEFKYHMTTPYDRLAKIYTNCSGHLTKVAKLTCDLLSKATHLDCHIPI